jgi:hypothetical protein
MEMYMVEVFKTNVRQRRQAKLLLSLMERQFPMLKINFDLDDCDKILRVEGESISNEKITTLVTGSGYLCEILQ